MRDTARSPGAIDAQNKIQECELKIGMETPERVEVLSGLAEGDVVVTGGRSQVKPGHAVRAKVGSR